MKTLAFVNQKGGCGKTTTAVNLAGALAARGERVLLVDLDPQAHATLALSVALESGTPSLADVLLRGCPLAATLQRTAGGITLAPATLELGEVEEAAQRTLHPEQVLREALLPLAHEFEHVLLDCPPRADGVLTANALVAADVAVLVVEMGAFALQGAHRTVALFRELARERELGFELRVLGTLFDRRAELARELLIGTQARFGPFLFDTVIHQSARLREAAASGVPVQVLDPAARATRDFEALAEEVVALRSPARAARELVGGRA